MTRHAGGSRPARIGRYRVVEAVGAGAFATVYRAIDERLDAPVAVKLLADNHSIDAAVRERFVQEGRLLRRVRSRHLIEVHDLGETDRAQPFLVLEWADRGDLASRLAERRAGATTATPADGLVLVRALAAALGSLHAARVVHRDLTPRNLLLRSEPRTTTTAPPAAGATPAEGLDPACVVDGDEQIVVADLGLSKDLARASGLTLATGTSGFAAPEQRIAGALVDQRADLWAASALVVWLATGDAPDEGGGWRDRVVDASWPAEVVGVLERGLDPSPEIRPATVEDWLRGVEKALGHGASLAGRGVGPDGQEADHTATASEGAPRPRDQPGRAGARRLIAVAAVVATLLMSTAAAYTLANDDRGGPAITTETLANGRERTVTEEHGVTVTIEGPTEVPVNEAAEFAAAVDGAASWAWVAPDGTMHSEVEGLDVVPVGSGRLTVRVIAADSGGHLVRASLEVRVTDG